MLACLAFCLASSFIYIVNDIVDREKDKLHPQKRNRPLASGAVKVPVAIAAAIFSLIIASALLYGLGSFKSAATVAIYIGINILYSWRLKTLPLVDVFCIAFGFILRLYAGALVIDVPVSGHLFMITLFIALFLAFGKRKSELLKIGAVARKSLSGYSLETIDKYLVVLAGAIIISYAIFTLDATVSDKFGDHMIYSLVFVIYGIFRYMAELDRSEDYYDPTENLYRDKILLTVCVAFGVYVMLTATRVLWRNL
ncbi:MAG: UbiA prenyltransferase family protein [Rickettsiales bacterium]|jgi:4-hydroxybenzoate polyprenyltransferase|nr:UbiA prenyltransferase family protein [Rickettsiales bacterium]